MLHPSIELVQINVGKNLAGEVVDLNFLDQIIMAKNAPKSFKGSYLIRASSLIEIVTLKLRLFLELKLANETKIFQIQGVLAEIGRMTGGWLKAANST